VKLDRLSVNEDWLERLDTESVKRRSAVQKNRVLLNNLFKTIPNRWVHSIDHALRSLDVLRNSLLDQGLHYERFEQLKRHFLRKSALVQLKVWTDNDNGSTGVVNALTEKVLSESSFLTLEHVAKRLERPGVGTNNRPSSAAVIDQRINGFLQKSLFVVDNRFRCVNLDNLLQPVVSVDDSSV
jgi:hypothetical protein